MDNHMEEQEMEAEALGAIYENLFVVESTNPNKWSVTLYPIDCQDPDESEQVNHVGCKLVVTLPDTYPEIAPELDLDIIKGLAQEQKDTILALAMEECENNLGMPAIYAVCEVIRNWLVDNNVKGLDDESMHAQMMRRAREEDMKKNQTKLQYESQKLKEVMSQAEEIEIAVRKRRAEGTPCTEENFYKWKAKFDQEMQEKQEQRQEDEEQLINEKGGKKKKKEEVDEQEGRLTGYEQFTQKLGLANMDALEQAALDAEGTEEDELDVDEDLFDDDDDLDDLDFSDEEEEDDDDDYDDDDSEVDI